MHSYFTSHLKEQCYGCRTCEQVCPISCISMETDDEGFMYPHIDEQICNNCSLCEKRCPNFYKKAEDEYQPTAFAAWAKDEVIRKASSSGGVFSVLANQTIKQSGVVFGCVLNDQMIAKHVGIDSIDELSSLRGSKYVQSDTNETYSKTKMYLKMGKYVLYSGTPCQIAGLMSFLGKNYDSLLTVDLICHGVPSPKIFSKYISRLETKNCGKVTDFKFRDKKNHGSAYGFTYTISKGNGTSIRRENGALVPYGYGFLKGVLSRPSCYICPYSTTNRVGDITLGDFWGVDKIHPEISPTHCGISLVLANTSKGRSFLDTVSNEIQLIITDIESAKKFNRNLYAPTDRPPEREFIYKELDKYSYEKIAKTYLRPNNYWVTIAKSLFPQRIKTKIKEWIRI